MKKETLKDKRKKTMKWVKTHFETSISPGCFAFIFEEIETQDKQFIKDILEKIEESAKDLNILEKDEDVLNWRRDIHAIIQQN
ncbi:MAG TPA: hypothetical protein ENG87_03910, partial [Candidatus Pacearchaeota archaeon]|nr:hypothetical protein [Candidatus Pacearchaeota archaeon]